MRQIGKRTCTLLLAVAMLLCTANAADPGASFYMTYRDNAVVMTSAGDIRIENGTFQVTDFCITPGQDPDAHNYIGQVHALESGQFIFSVGRSGSSEAAAFLNEKLSGYNDLSANGDRTTFDHTADALNFAFVGDLRLAVSTPDIPQGISVLFPGVVFAQGSTLFSNNWWFGQLNGQHTRDSDGPNSMLVIGTDETGNTVYASFLRGGNAVNEVSLEALCIAAAAEDTAKSVGSVESAFSSLPLNGTQLDLSGFPGSYDPSVNHIQGYSLYDGADDTRYSILTHSVATADYAHIVAGPQNGGDKWGFKTYLKDWRHPGGVQVIGDYLLVPSEQDTKAHIALYDLRALQVGELRRVERFDLSVAHKAGALGITSYTDASGVSYYVMIVAHLDGENSVYHVYRAAAAGGLEAAEFTEVGNFPLEKDFQGFGLVTETGTNDIYMIGLWAPAEGATFADHAYLYQLDTKTWTIGEELDHKHLTSTGGLPGVMGVHFRYGANVYVDGAGKLTISATERNSVLGSSLATNEWVPVN